jgi:hypothetical protein
MRRGSWEYVERTNGEGTSVVIVASTPERKLLFVEQTRVPIQSKTIEMPAGLVGDIDAKNRFCSPPSASCWRRPAGGRAGSST